MGKKEDKEMFNELGIPYIEKENIATNEAATKIDKLTETLIEIIYYIKCKKGEEIAEATLMETIRNVLTEYVNRTKKNRLYLIGMIEIIKDKIKEKW